MTYANGQKLNVHHGDERNCKSCEKEQWEVCWTLSNVYIKYQDEDGQFHPDTWNSVHLETDEFGGRV